MRSNLLSKIWARIKWLKWPMLILAALVIILLAIWGACDCDYETPVKKDWQAVKVETTSGPPATWMPWFKPTKADKLLKDWPVGTRIIEVEPQEETVYIAIPPSGPIQTPRGINGITVYEKPISKTGLEFRPYIGAGVSLPDPQPSAMIGVDLFKIWRLHTGPGVCVGSGFSGVWTASVGAWRNVDIRAGGGYGTSGAMGCVGVTIGIE